MKIIDKIFRDKKANTVIYILLALGIIMLMCGSSFISSKPKTEMPLKIEDSLKEETEAILSQIKGVGEASVMISYSTKKEDDDAGEEIKGVLVVSDGGGSSTVKEKIVSALEAALGVEAHKIQVFERKE